MLRKAGLLCKEILKQRPGLPEAVLCLSRIAVSNGDAGTATRLLRGTPDLLKQPPHALDALLLLASAEETAGDWDASAEALEQALRRLRVTKPKAPKETDVMGRLARAHWKAGNRENAGAVAQETIEKEATQREACEVATAILMNRGDKATSLALMTRCLIAHRNEPAATLGELVCGVMTRCAPSELRDLLKTKDGDEAQQRSVAEVLGYVGLILKDRSEVAHACRMYRAATSLAPNHGSLCLNLMHTFFLRRDTLPALAHGVRYFRQLGASGRSPAAAAICAAVLRGEVEQEAPPLSSEDLGDSFLDAVAIGFAMQKFLFLALPHRPLAVCSESVEPRAPKWQQRLAEYAVEAEPTRISSLVEQSWFENGGQEHSIDADATAAEVETHRRILLRISQVMEETRKGRDLHLTLVRNEHAYFACMHDILHAAVPPTPLPSPAFTPIYVIGDSHVMPTAWQTFELQLEGNMRQMVLVPCLTTGCKIWHLRDESNFYPKFAFWEQIANIPAGAPVILLLGEIDCRDGILTAVMKDKYPSVEVALSAVCNIYMDVLAEVRKKLRRSPIFVHPVLQVLKETRVLTGGLNELLSSAQSLARMKKAGVELLSMPMHTFFSGDVEGENVKLEELQLLPDLVLDGTHINPSYVRSHLAPALAAAWPAATAAVKSS